MNQGVFKQITIIGLGLIGSSIARAARQYNLAGTIVGCDKSEVALSYGQSHQFLDDISTDARVAVAGSELIVLATPPSTLGSIAAHIKPALAQGAIVMDVASVKRAPMETITPHIPKGVTFIPAHPIAGSEHSGIAAGRADLFSGKRVIVTPPTEEQTEALTAIAHFWSRMGARVEGMPAQLHDMIYAYVSHLPQLLATTAGAVLGDAQPAAPDATFERFMRLSNSNMALWVDIFALNADNILVALNRYLDALTHVQKELASAPEPGEAAPDETLAHCVLFPRIAASCLITTVMEAEKKAGFSFARFAGTGFADVTSPAAIPPDEDLERISNQHLATSRILGDYAQRLRDVSALFKSGDFSL